MRILLAKAANITSTTISIIPPLGLLYLAGFLSQKRPQDEVRFIDMRLHSAADYVALIRSWVPDVVGISTMTMEATNAHALAAAVKQANPSTTVVMGGPHPTGYTEEVLADRCIDLVVLHEGELTFAAVLDQLEGARDFGKLCGIAYRDEHGEVRITPSREYVKDLDVLPLPQWDLVDFHAYEKCKPMGLIGGYRVAPIFTSRACPYQCTYCHDMFGKRFQKRSVANVIGEIELLVNKYGVRHFEIVDDIFNIDRQRTRQILQEIIDRKLDIRLAFPNGLRGDLLTDELVDLFAQAGTEYVSLAVETASERLQKQIKKHLNFARVQASIRAFVDRRVFTNCFYMLGFPSETQEELRRTVDFACAQPSHTALFFIVNPFKGTELSRELGAAADIPVEQFSNSYHNATVNASEIPISVLHREAKMAYLKFFSNPIRISRIVRDYPNRRYLWNMAALQLNRMLFDYLNRREERAPAPA